MYKRQRILIAVELGIERVEVRSKINWIGSDVGHTAVRIADRVLPNLVSRKRAGPGVLVDPTTLFVSAGILVNGSDVEDAVIGDHAVGKEARCRALNIHAAHGIDVSDLVVGDCEQIGAIDKNAALRIGNDVAVHYRAVPDRAQRHALAPLIDAVGNRQGAAQPFGDHIVDNFGDGSVEDEHPKLKNSAAGPDAGNAVAGDFSRYARRLRASGACAVDLNAVRGEVMNTCLLYTSRCV